MTTRRLVILVALVCAACKEAARAPAAPGAGPQIRATVVTIRAAVRPPNRINARTIVIAGNRARDLTEKDAWRLFDTERRTVTTVDDVARTIRTESLETILRSRRTATAGNLPSYYPSPALRRTGEKRPILGLEAEQTVIESGAYRRELWFASHKSIPENLFAMMYASEPLSSPLVPMMRSVDEELVEVRGFPILDRAEVPLDGSTLIVEQAVVSVGAKDVPEALFEVPKDYLDLTPKPAKNDAKRKRN